MFGPAVHSRWGETEVRTSRIHFSKWWTARGVSFQCELLIKVGGEKRNCMSVAQVCVSLSYCHRSFPRLVVANWRQTLFFSAYR